MFLVIAIVLSILLLLLLIPISISFEYIRQEEKDRALLTVFIIGKWLKINIPLTDLNNKQSFPGSKFIKKLKIFEKDTDQTDKKEEQLFNGFAQAKKRIGQFFSNYPIYRKVFNSTMGYFRKKIICRDFIFNLDFGLDDAALTGITTGFLWGIVYNVLAFLDRFIIIKKTDIKIQPVFNEAVFNVKFYCIFTFRVVHIIIGFLILIFSLIKALLKEKFISGTFRTGRNNVRV